MTWKSRARRRAACLDIDITAAQSIHTLTDTFCRFLLHNSQCLTFECKRASLIVHLLARGAPSPRAMALRRKSLARLRDPVVIGALGVIGFLYSVTVFNVVRLG